MLIGRKSERQLLLSLLESDKSEFVAVYGRRRVGKTYLVRESYNYDFAFEHTGRRNGKLCEQLKDFRDKLIRSGDSSCPRLTSWSDAFSRLGTFLEHKTSGRKLVFFDECPWMDTPKSGFVDALDHFWNDWCTMRKDIVLIICGSAASWIIDKVIDSYGGLHNRLTRQIYVRPFTLQECEAFTVSRGIVFNHRQILECYMIMGGIPYYWDLLDKSKGLAQNIDWLFFRHNGELSNEFSHLYSSLFKNAGPYLAIVMALGKKKYGLNRDEIIQETGLQLNGNLTNVLRALEQCDFIRSYTLPGRKSHGTIYQLIDNFTLFHLRFLENANGYTPNYWSIASNSQPVRIWCGLAFERVVMQHLEELRHALGIGAVIANVYQWRHHAAEDKNHGAQIDLIIDRKDQVVNLCEMKYREDNEPYELSSEEHRNLLNRREAYRQDTGTRSAIHLTLVTVNGVKHNAYWNDIQAKVTLDDLFAN